MSLESELEELRALKAAKNCVWKYQVRDMIDGLKAELESTYKDPRGNDLAAIKAGSIATCEVLLARLEIL